MAEHGFDEGNWVQDLSWTAVEQRLAAGAAALLPIGAASKEHGPHLPHGTDYIQASYYAERLAETFDFLIWPVATYGYYPVFTEYPGSISLREETFRAIVAEILDGIVHAGASRVVVLNTGVSTIAPLEQLLEVRETRPPMKLINCYAGPRFARAVHEIEEQAFGGHADEVETALMLAIDPSRVALDRARPAEIHVKRGMFNRTDPDAPNYSPTGVNGDPTRATIEKGERLLAALIEDLMAEVSEFAQ